MNNINNINNMNKCRTMCNVCSYIPGNDRYVYTHNASECPFLKTVVCQNCLEMGHFDHQCRAGANMTALKKPGLLKYGPTTFVSDSCSSMDCDVDDKCDHCLQKYNERIKMEIRCDIHNVKMLTNYESKVHRQDIINGSNKGQCNFCKNSKEYNENNVWFNNHIMKNCPRLALVVCKLCRGRGHNDKHCTVFKGFSNMKLNDLTDLTDLIVDFDAIVDEDEMQM